MKINPKECFLYYKEGICLYERKDLGHSVKYNLILRLSYARKLPDEFFYPKIKELNQYQNKVGKALFLAKEEKMYS